MRPMNRVARRQAERDRRRWLAAIERSDLPAESKIVACALAAMADVDGTVIVDIDERGVR